MAGIAFISDLGKPLKPQARNAKPRILTPPSPKAPKPYSTLIVVTLIDPLKEPL